MKKQAGILMPVASLPNPYGSGDFGPAAYTFAESIAKAGFSIWQILPLNPLGYGNSPYQPYSSYAMDELYISPELLEKDGLIQHQKDYRRNAGFIDYQKVRQNREQILREAFANFREDEEYDAFVKQSDWLMPYAVFRAFKSANELRSWIEWPVPMRDYPLKKGIDLKPYKEEIRYHCFLQYILFKQWTALKNFVNERGIKIMGDIPFYVGQDSADCWNGRPNFLLTKTGKPRFIAGVPPDYFAVNGQRWGNPIYDWKYMKKDRFRFWTERISFCTKLFDIIRLDHFRAFDTYWKIPSSCPTAVVGKWIEAPGYQFFDLLLKKYPDLQIVAEDLGDLRPEVLELRDHYRFPGMHVLQFDFHPEGETWMNPHSVLYTGTHDNITLRAWYGKKSPREKRMIRRWLEKRGYNDKDVFGKLLHYSLKCEPEITVIPMFDWLRQRDSSTINRPGTVGSPNWEYRITSFDMFFERLPEIQAMLEETGRSKNITK